MTFDLGTYQPHLTDCGVCHKQFHNGEMRAASFEDFVHPRCVDESAIFGEPFGGPLWAELDKRYNGS